MSPVRAEQAQPVETYYSQSLGQPIDTVLPEGVEWNKPIQPGQLKLPQDDTPAANKKKTSKAGSRLPVGDMQAPQMNASQPMSNSALSKHSTGLVASPGMELGQPGAAASSLGAPQGLGAPSLKNSAANLMLMQGMKNALKQAGGEAGSSSSLADVAADAASQDITQVPLTPAGTTPASSQAQQAPVTEGDIAYQAGREPKSLSAPAGHAAKSQAAPALQPALPVAAPTPASKNAEAFEPSQPLPEEETAAPPKRTLPQPPATPATESVVAPLAKKDDLPAELPFAKGQSVAPVAEPVKPELRQPATVESINKTAPVSKKAAKAVSKPAESSSIFGPPVDEAGATPAETETAPEAKLSESRAARSNLNATSTLPEAPASAPVAPVSAMADTSAVEAPVPQEPACTPESKPWTRSCAEVGYPATYQGQIAGETKTECPGGSVHDIWLSNTCGPSAKEAEKPARAVEAKTEKPVKTPKPEAVRKVEPVSPVVEKSQPKAVIAPVVTADKPAVVPAAKVEKTNKADGGVCGLAAEIPTETKPMAYLCRAGQASAVVGSGPWRWNCATDRRGKIATCETPMKAPAPEKKDEKVETPALQSLKASAPEKETAPSPQTAAEQPAAPVESPAPAATPAPAPAPVPAVEMAQPAAPAAAAQTSVLDGRCGSAQGKSVAMPPVKNLCETGTPGVITQNPEGTAWIWVCEGAMGADTSSCQAPVTLSGASMKQQGAPLPAAADDHVLKPPAAALASEEPLPQQPSAPSARMTQERPSTNGQCGPAAGRVSVHPPTGDGLCAAGAVTDVSGTGPWMWQCVGLNGGQTVACQAPSSAHQKLEQTTAKSVHKSEASSVLPAAPKAGTLGTIEKTANQQPLPEALPAPPDPALAADLAIPEAPQPPLLSAATTPVPAKPALNETSNVPLVTPTLPDDVKEVPPPATQDGLQTPSLPETLPQPSAGGTLVLDSDLSSLSFDELRTGLTSDSQQTLNKVAAAMARKPGARLMLIGYAASGNNGSSPREARQISLQRVLAVRDYLVGKGVASNRLDVRALGANVPSGNMDRVDLKAN